MLIKFISWLLKKWGANVPEIQEFEYKLKNCRRQLAERAQEISDLKGELGLSDALSDSLMEELLNAQEEVKQLDYLLQLERMKKAPVADEYVAAAQDLVMEQQAKSAVGTSGEYKRHQVFAALIDRFPQAAKRDLSLAIETAVREVLCV